MVNNVTKATNEFPLELYPKYVFPAVIVINFLNCAAFVNMDFASAPTNQLFVQMYSGRTKQIDSCKKNQRNNKS